MQKNNHIVYTHVGLDEAHLRKVTKVSSVEMNDELMYIRAHQFNLSASASKV
jgi:hypothetical protein